MKLLKNFDFLMNSYFLGGRLSKKSKVDKRIKKVKYSNQAQLCSSCIKYFTIYIRWRDSIYWLPLCEALPPISAVIKDSCELAWTYWLLLKWEDGLGQGCPKTVCPPFKPSGLFWKLHFWNQQTKLHCLHYLLRQYIDFHLDSIYSLVCSGMSAHFFLFFPKILM